MKILLANPRGFCAGVDRAIDVVELALKVFGTPLFVKHAIVHNDYVVERLEEKGVTFVEHVDEVPVGGRVVFSAHGSPPSDYTIATKRNLQVIDATCPLVTKVHLEVQRYAREGYTIIVVGHRGHVEMRGTLGEAPEHTHLVESAAEVRALNMPTDAKIAVLTQTTLSMDDTKATLAEIKKIYPEAVLPPSSDICYATTNRQAAVKQLAERADVIIVVGSKASSNTNRLVDVARAQGVTAYRINAAHELQSSWFDDVSTIGITSGASAPDDLVQSVVAALKQNYPIDSIQTVTAVDEQVWFDLPPDIKKSAAEKGIDTEIVTKHSISADQSMRV